ncbi:MAG: hypothetical protein JST54_23135 [Deltaproteobacteria bacterium]|nr:hypothetical protein [Deltaproteobacteria bacterium]
MADEQTALDLAMFRRDAIHRLSWAGNPLVFASFWLGGMFWLVSIAMAWPYLAYVTTGTKAHGQTWAFDPTKEGPGSFHLFVAASAVFAFGIAVRFLSGAAGRRRLAAETAWAARLPFPVVGYPAVVGREWFWYRIHIAFTSPFDATSETFAGLMRRIDPAIKVTGRAQAADLEIEYSRNRTEAQNTRALIATVHRLVDEVLVPGLGANPVASVTFE